MSGIIGAGSKSGVIGETELDYEVGQHTWSLTGSSGGTWTPRSLYTTLSYTKIGKLVHVVGKFETTGSISGSKGGSLRLSLPFTSANTANASGHASGTCSLRRGSNTIASTPIAVIWEANSHLTWQIPHLTGGSEAYVSASDVDATVEGEVGITYIAA